MARAYKIPPPLISGFVALKGLTTDEVSSISEVLRNLKVGVSRTNALALLGQLNIPNIYKISNTVLSLGNLLVGSSIEDVLNSILLSLQMQNEDNFGKDNDKQFVNNLQLLLENSNIVKLTYKSVDLLTENENVYLESRVLTDIRLLFEDTAPILDGNAVIFHQLSIEYKNGDNDCRTMFSLSLADLKKLHNNIERAIEKHSAIENKYNTTTNFIEVQEE